MNSFLLDTVRTQVQKTPLDKSPPPRDNDFILRSKSKELPLKPVNKNNTPTHKEVIDQRKEEHEIDRIRFHEVLSPKFYLKEVQDKLEQETGLSEDEIQSLNLFSPLNQKDASEEINPSEFLAALSMSGGIHGKKPKDQEEEFESLFAMDEGLDIKGVMPEAKNSQSEDSLVLDQTKTINPIENKAEKVATSPFSNTVTKDDLVVKGSLEKGENTTDQDILNVNSEKGDNQNKNILDQGEKVEKQPDQEKNSSNTLKNITKEDKISLLKSNIDDEKQVKPEEPINQDPTKLNQQKEALALQLNLVEDGTPKVTITTTQRANLKQTTYLEEQTKHQLIRAQEEESELPSFEDLKRDWIVQTAPDEEKDLPQDIKNFNASIKEGKSPGKAGESTLTRPSSGEMLPQQQAPGSITSGVHNVEGQRIPVYTAPHQASLATQVFQGILNARQENTNRFFIQMQPPKLGMVKVDLEFKDGRMRAVFSAEKKTLNLLKDDTQKLEQSLKEMGIEVDPEGFEFTLSDQSTKGDKTPFEETSKLHEMIAEKFLKTEEMVPLVTDLKSHFISLNHTFHEVA